MKPITVKEQGASFLGEKGINMIEVMIALAILCVGILGVGAMQITAVESNISANKHSSAARIGSWAIEELINAKTLSGYGEFNNGKLIDEAYDVAWSTENGPKSDTTWITVDVTWKSRKGQQTQTLRYLRYN